MPRKSLLAALAVTVLLTSFPAYALSVQDFKAKTVHDQTTVITDFIDKMTGDLRRSNPQLATNIRDYFFVTRAGERYAEGLWNLEVELAALDRAAKNGKADLSKIQIEGVIVKI